MSWRISLRRRPAVDADFSRSIWWIDVFEHDRRRRWRLRGGVQPRLDLVADPAHVRTLFAGKQINDLSIVEQRRKPAIVMRLHTGDLLCRPFFAHG